MLVHLIYSAVLTFSVPVGDADEAMSLTTPISWSDFEFALANALSVAPNAVRVAYKFSTEPQSSSFHHVRNESELAELVNDAQVAEDGLAKSKSRMKKKFVVHLKCTGEQSQKEKKEKGKGKAKAGKNKVCISPVSI